VKQIFLLESGILTYLAFAAIADGNKVYVTNRKGKIVGFVNRNTVSVIDISAILKI